MDTRHNVGFRVVEELAEGFNVSFKRRLFRAYWMGKALRDGEPLYLVKPYTFMNQSGRVFPEILRDTGLSISEILVICDNLDLSPGNCRFRLRGSAGGHKGLESIIRHLGTESFMRLTVGIGRPAYKGEVADHVLRRPRGEEAAHMEEGIHRAAAAVLLLLSKGPTEVMNEINRREPPSGA
jgi:PTH1 family peptidyl-tRNA hydrolase